ncbi:MAG: nitrile hydratase subunit beta [Thaumarchaeota archaeon]|jgi:hypothetical protein|nr:nitrile hydratase subunit beta [Nitrososphaerota archaeon]
MQDNFKPGKKVHIKTTNPEGTHRTPKYIMGKSGTIYISHGALTGYEVDHSEDWGPLYTVEFQTEEISRSKSIDKILVDVHEDWLEPEN